VGPIRPRYARVFPEVRKDWPVVEIKGAKHISCIFKPQFREEIAAWLKKNTR
jgi:hypothetical protein